MSQEFISVHKANIHNLKNISLDIPRNQLVVVTGPSGSGKSSLAFDTLYVEGQRRYIESLSSYARQFLGQMTPPDVESIVGLSPSIAIDQKSTSRNPRSTVGTTTEIHDYLRILFARVGDPYCPQCGQEISSQSPEKISESILKFPKGSKLQILSPVVRNKKGTHKELIHKYLTLGFSKARIDGELQNLDDSLKLSKNLEHNIDLVIDRILLKDNSKSRLTESVEHALSLSEGLIIVLENDKEHYFSEKSFCSHCDIYFPELEPRSFSFNSPIGACPDCNGLGLSKEFDQDSLVDDPNLSLLDGAIPVIYKKNNFLLQMIKDFTKQEKVDIKLPFRKLPAKYKDMFFNGSSKIYEYKFKSENSSFNFKKEFPGIINWLKKKYRETSSEKIRQDLDRYMDIKTCSGCQGERLNHFARSVKILDYTIGDIGTLSLDQASQFFKKLKLTGEKKIIAEKLVLEINNRLNFLLDVGLKYLTLNRPANTLSGGENQRIRLATQIGSALSGVLYVLDEPSIGLHQRDNEKLIKTLVKLKELGNSVIVVEHDEDTMRTADHIIDIGPGAGINGGEIVFEGNFQQIIKCKNSLTGQFLSGASKIEIPSRRKQTQFLEITGAEKNNLKKIDVKLPLQNLVGITGVSGSGKSTLVHEIISPAMKSTLSKEPSLVSKRFKTIKNAKLITSIIELDQSPIGRTPRSNIMTYTGAFDEIRKLFTSTPESKVRGYKPGRFSFNVKGGRCEDCQGDGVKKIEMHFLPDVYITCEICHGKRYNSETLTIFYKGLNISDIFQLTVEEAYDFFKNFSKLRKIFKTLNDVGLGYIKIGQSSTTLSGGEAQRIKLARELSKSPRGHCLYILDEPTTGLHFHDINMLLKPLHQLVDLGHSVLVIEHNLDVIKCCDYLIDLGPEGGEEGGEIIAQGTPEQVSKIKKSYTGQFLNKILK